MLAAAAMAAGMFGLCGGTAHAAPTPGPEGTVVVRVEIPEGQTDTATFGFGGNLAGTPGGRFELTVEQGRPVETSFTRPAGTWELTEDQLPSGWVQTSLNCRSTGGSSLAVVGPEATIRLAPGDTVSCTYINMRTGGSAPVSMFRLRSIFDALPMFPATVMAPQLAAAPTHVSVPMRAGMSAMGAVVTGWWVVARRRERDREHRAAAAARRSRSAMAGASGR